MHGSIKIKLALFCFSFNAVGLFLFGLIYTFSSELLPFHLAAISTSWDELPPVFQVLYLGMMKTEGAGFLSSAVAIVFLLAIPFRRGERWSAWAILAIGVVEHFPGVIGAMTTSQLTPASSPWQLSLLGMSLLGLGLVLSLSHWRTIRHPD